MTTKLWLPLLLALAACQPTDAPADALAPPPDPPAHRRLGASYNDAALGPGTQLQYDSQGFANSGVVKAAPGGFLGAYGFNNGAATIYVMFFNSTTVPANASIPSMAPIPVPAGGTFSLLNSQTVGGTSFGPPMSVGLSWAGSTTAASLTVDTTNSTWLTCQFF
jgi:hypothetical protein